MTDNYEGPFSAGGTRLGMMPVDLPRIHQGYRSPLPDIDGMAHDPPALRAAMLDLCANALWHAGDREELSASDPHMVQVMKLVEWLDLDGTRRESELETATGRLAVLQGQAEAYRKAYERERAAAQTNAEYAQQLLALNEKRRTEADLARRTLAEVMSQLFAAKSRLAEQDVELLECSFDKASRSTTGHSAAELTLQLAPPADEDAFSDPETQVVDVEVAP